jgi:hypothetical protein
MLGPPQTPQETDGLREPRREAPVEAGGRGGVELKVVRMHRVRRACSMLVPGPRRHHGLQTLPTQDMQQHGACRCMDEPRHYGLPASSLQDSQQY